jgi:hypothetical protein
MRQAGIKASNNKASSYVTSPEASASMLHLSDTLSLSQSSSDSEASSSSTGLFLRSKTIIMPPKGNRCGSRQAGRLQNKHLLTIHKLAAPN